MSCSKLCVIEKKCSLRCGFLLEGYGRALGFAGGSDLEICDLAAEIELKCVSMRGIAYCLPEREEVLDFLLTGCGTDVRDVDGACRHDCMIS